MAMKIPDIGTKNLLDIWFKNAPLSINVRLFKSLIVPAATDTLATYTVAEANYLGYAAQLVGTWATATGPDGTGHASTIHTPDLSFVVGTGNAVNNSIYGYFVTDSTNTKLLWAEQFVGGPYVMFLAGSTITLTPSFLLKSEF